MLADSFVSIRDWNAPLTESIGWWEYDVFVGYTAIAVMLVFGAYAVSTHSRHRRLLIPIGVIFVLSMGGTFRPIADLPIPFLNSERGPTRFLIVPVFFLLVLAAVGASRLMARRRGVTISSAIGWALLSAVALELHRHLDVWRLARIEVGFAHRAMEHAAIVVQDDPDYVGALQTGWLLSASTLLLLVGYGLYARARDPRERDRATGRLRPITTSAPRA